MIRPPLYTQDLFDCRDNALVGGKAANLGRLLRGGFPVPDGFVITTRGYRHARESSNGNGVSEDAIARRAYEIYISRGAQHGQDFDDWIAAERELKQPAARSRKSPAHV